MNNYVPLGDIVDIKGGGTPDKKVAAFWDGDIPWASVKDFKSGILDQTVDRITAAGVAASATNIIPAGHIIVPTRMAVGKAAINTIDLAINQDLKALFPKVSVNTRYLYNALLANSGKLLEQATGATVKGIKLDALRGLKIPLPPMEEQKRITAILDQADALRRLRIRALERLNTLGQAIFHEMFGDVHRNPKGFERIQLGELIKVSSGRGLTAKDMKSGEFPVYGGNGINGYHDEGPIPANTILIGRVGAYCGAVHTTTSRCWVTDNALIVRNTAPANTAYLAAALELAELNQYAGRAAQPLVSGSRIYPVEILLPPLDAQDEFEHALVKSRDQKDLIDRSVASFDALFAALQYRIFQGEL